MSGAPPGWRRLPCVVGCDALIPAPPGCARAWHTACADRLSRQRAAEREAEAVRWCDYCKRSHRADLHESPA